MITHDLAEARVMEENFIDKNLNCDPYWTNTSAYVMSETTGAVSFTLKFVGVNVKCHVRIVPADSHVSM